MKLIVENQVEEDAIVAVAGAGGGEVEFASEGGGRVWLSLNPLKRDSPTPTPSNPQRPTWFKIHRLQGRLVTPESELLKLQGLVESVLVTFSSKIHAAYKENTPTDLSYYILLKEDTLKQKQAIIGKLYRDPIDQLRQNGKPVYYNFFPKDQEPLLSEMVKLAL